MDACIHMCLSIFFFLGKRLYSAWGQPVLARFPVVRKLPTDTVTRLSFVRPHQYSSWVLMHGRASRVETFRIDIVKAESKVEPPLAKTSGSAARRWCPSFCCYSWTYLSGQVNKHPPTAASKRMPHRSLLRLKQGSDTASRHTDHRDHVRAR